MGVLACGSTTTGRTPNIGSEAAPGFIGWQPGRLVTMCPPVSVCQKVSTMTQRPLPTSSKKNLNTGEGGGGGGGEGKGQRPLPTSSSTS